jgi:hypothetical protein
VGEQGVTIYVLLQDSEVVIERIKRWWRRAAPRERPHRQTAWSITWMRRNE